METDGWIQLLLVTQGNNDFPPIKSILKNTGLRIQCHQCTQITDAIIQLSSQSFDGIIIDLDLPDAKGIPTLKAISQQSGNGAVIGLTSQAEKYQPCDVLSSGAQDFLIKDQLNPQALSRCIIYSIERKKAQIQISETQALNQNIMESANDGIVICKQNGNILSLNPSAEKLFGLKEQEMIGASIEQWFLYDQDNTPLYYIRELSNNARTVNQENISLEGGINTADGSTIPIEYTVSFWYVDSCKYFSVFIRDITQRKIIESKIQLALELQESISAIQSQRGLQCSLAEKLNQALDALLEMSCIKTIAGEGASLVIKDGTAPPCKIQRNMRITDFEIVQLNLNSEHTIGSLKYYKAGKNRHWLPITSIKGTTLGYLVLSSIDAMEKIVDCRSQIELIITIIASLIEEHRFHTEIKKLNYAIEQSPSAVLITDEQGIIHYANQAISTLTGYSTDEIIGKKTSLFKSDRHPKEFYTAMWSAIKKGEIWRGELQNKRKNGDCYWESMIIAPIVDGDKNTNFVAIKENIDQRKQYETQLNLMARHDPLTGLPNRASLLETINNSLEKIKQNGGGLAVLLLDLDQFKLINDQQGHIVGDDLLKKLACRLRRKLPDSVLVGRQGGDEFILIIPETVSKTKIKKIIEKTLKIISRPFYLGKFVTKISTSIGAVICTNPNESAEEIYRKADIAMYQAKENGGNSACFFSHELEDAFNTNMWFRTAISKALGQNQLSVYYQPQVDLNNGYMTGMEALLRWNHPEKGNIPPDRFIPIAVETGYIIEIGLWVISEVCRQIRSWLDSGFHPPRVAINVSALQLVDDTLVSHISATLAKYSLTADYLEVEITESEMMHSPELAVKALSALRNQGIHVAGDDFGTGYSSLAYLKRLPLDRLKIDRSFITDIVTDHESFAIASMIITLGHNLGLKVVAEGVESAEQIRLLSRLKCDEFQGYYCSVPLPAKEFSSRFFNKGSLINVDKKSLGTRYLLLLDDEKPVLQALYRTLRNDNYDILRAESAEEAFTHLAEHEVAVILCDQRIPDISGTEFLSRVKKMYPDTIRIVLSGYTDLNTILNAINSGFIFKFLTKPWDDDLLREHISEAFMFYDMKKSHAAVA